MKECPPIVKSMCLIERVEFFRWLEWKGLDPETAEKWEIEQEARKYLDRRTECFPKAVDKSEQMFYN